MAGKKSADRIRDILADINVELDSLFQFLDGNPAVLSIEHIHGLMSQMMLEVGYAVGAGSTEGGKV